MDCLDYNEDYVILSYKAGIRYKGEIVIGCYICNPADTFKGVQTQMYGINAQYYYFIIVIWNYLIFIWKNLLYIMVMKIIKEIWESIN